MENYKKRQGMNVKEAAQEAASFVGFHQTTVQKYRNDFFQNKGTFKERKQGKYERATVYHDQQWSKEVGEGECFQQRKAQFLYIR